jgi:two-component system sensor histidine kinase KdpD
VSVSARRSAEHICVSVIDSGDGIPADQLPFVFSPRYRAPTAIERTAGYGLGLYAVRRLVELYGGRIWVESPPGGGARFSFTLPAYAPAALAAG